MNLIEQELVEQIGKIEINGIPEPLTYKINAISSGPVITSEPTVIDYGSINVLELVPKNIKLTNESIIPAKINLSFKNDSTIWTLEKTQLKIPPGESVDLKLCAILDDCINFRDSLLIHVENGNLVEIPLSGRN